MIIQGKLISNCYVCMIVGPGSASLLGGGTIGGVGGGSVSSGPGHHLLLAKQPPLTHV